ncbi:MAG: helix-turn-helix transcriptional regulator [Ruminococcaceae bacterium]|nr:helix-turn-helix transcriptional regulator [Oscillospiraceae bacterium]
MFFDQLKQLCAMKGTTPTALARDLGISTSNVTSWKNGSSPKLDMVLRLASALDVPIGYFAGEDDAEIRKSSELSEDEAELLDVYRQLRISGKRQIFGKAYELLDAQKTPPEGGEDDSSPDIGVVAPILERRIKK